LNSTPDRVPGRVATVVAVGALGLDGLLLLGAGSWSDSTGLVLGGVTCLLLAGLVLLGWRRHRRIAAELAEARRELRQEVESLRQLIRK
jgi:hypothetical protein